MFELGIAPREIFLAYSTQFVFSTTRLVPGNVVMVAIDMSGKSPITGELIYGITWKHVYFNIVVFFIVDPASVLKLLCPTVYGFYLDGSVDGCFVVVFYFIYLLIYFFICLFNNLFIYLLFFYHFDCYFLLLLSLLSSLLLLLLLESSLPFVGVWLLLLLV